MSLEEQFEATFQSDARSVSQAASSVIADEQGRLPLQKVNIFEYATMSCAILAMVIPVFILLFVLLTYFVIYRSASQGLRLTEQLVTHIESDEHIEVQRISATEAYDAAQGGGVLFLESSSVPTDSRAQIPDSIPSAWLTWMELEREVPLTAPLIIYCVCTDENTSVHLALALMQRGYTNVQVLVGGLSAWIAAGQPVRQGE